MRQKQEMLAALREEAEKLLSGKASRRKKNDSVQDDLNELLHEIQVYQVELEMQNDELKQSQAELEREKIRFVNLFNHAPVAYFVLDHTAVIEQCNDSSLNIFDILRNQILNRRFQSFLLPEDSDHFHQFVRRLLQNKKDNRCEIRLIFNGRIFHTLIHGIAIKETDSIATKFYLGITDLTDKKLAEEKEEASSARLQMTLKASAAGTWNINLQTGNIFLDELASSIFGFAANSFDGRYTSLLALIHDADSAKFDQTFRNLMSHPIELNHEFRIVTKSGESKFIEVRGHVVKLNGVDHNFIGIITDISKRKQLELEAAESRADQQKKLLRTIIETQENERQRISNTLHDSVGQLLYGTSLKLQHAANFNDSSFQAASRLLDQAIRETRNISFELAPSILADFGLNVAVPEMVKRIVTAPLTIKTDIKGFETRVKLSSEIFIFRIVQELVNNIIKHSNCTEALIEIKRKKEQITISVKDNGIGINTENKTTDGTGLYSIKNRIALYNGTMSVDSKKKKGTTIVIQLFNVE